MFQHKMAHMFAEEDIVGREILIEALKDADKSMETGVKCLQESIETGKEGWKKLYTALEEMTDRLGEDREQEISAMMNRYMELEFKWSSV
jgi:hypothetical protein